MATGEYLKTAAASLRNAAVSLQQQAKEMQASLIRLKSDKNTQIDRTKVMLKTKQVEVGVISDTVYKSRLSVEIQKLQDEIVAAEQLVRQTESDIQNAVKTKLDKAIGIEQQAKQLENDAGTID